MNINFMFLKEMFNYSFLVQLILFIKLFYFDIISGMPSHVFVFSHVYSVETFAIL